MNHFLPRFYAGGDAAALWLWDVYGIIDDDVVIGVDELFGDVLRDEDFPAHNVTYEDVQIAVTFARQLAKGVEGGLDALDAGLRFDGEVDGARLCTQLAPSEIVAAGLIGDEGFYLMDVFHTREVGHLKAVGLDDSGTIGLNRQHTVFDEFRQIQLLARHQQVVGRIDDGTGSLVLAASRETRQLFRLQVGDVAGECL